MMDEGETKNDYAVYVIFTREVMEDSLVVDKLMSLSTTPEDILYCRGSFDNNNNKTNRYICCLRKTLFEHLINNCNFKRDEEFNISKYRVGSESLSNGMTYGFFIRVSNQDEINYITSIFDRFENSGFLFKDSYSINIPNPYPDGSERGYIIISFEKNQGRYPRQYIKKLKALINNTIINGRKLHVNWVSNSVLKDVISSENKERKTSSRPATH